jgi:hypothetical protein
MNLRLVVNNGVRQLSSMFPGFFPAAKHNHYADFGFPTTLSFKQLYDMYLRNGIAHAAVDKTIAKTWQENPFILDHERDGSEGGDKKETPLERDIRLRFDALRVWQRLADTDARSMVGKYAAVILRLADGKKFDQPVDRVPGGLDGLVEIVPAWEGQLTVSEWDTDETSETYGQPKMFAFNEANVATGQQNHRAFNVHPDRVIVWSKTGDLHGSSALEAGYNDLVTIEKIVGAGGEGFWKNAKSAPVLEVDKEAKIVEMAKAMGVQPSEVADKMNEQVEDWQKGFDQLLMIQGMQAKTLGVTLPSPEHFFGVALQSFAASVSIPLKILVGNQTGERASTEDATDWAQTNNARRANIVVPNILTLVRRLERFGILAAGKDWFIDWADLTEASMAEKIDRAVKMTEANDKMKDTREFVFTPEEIRAVADYEPLKESEKYRDETSEEDEDAALPNDPEPTE